MNLFKETQKKSTCLYYKILLRIAIFVVMINGLAIYYYLSAQNNISTETPKRKTENVLKHDKRLANDESLVSKESGLLRSPVLSNNIFKSRTMLAMNKSDESDKLGDYPPDLFTKEQKGSGYIALHVTGICYMFLALALVCDEFFVPALHIISKILNISDDVAGATFMAAGGSAPELFTSIVGVFFTTSNVGFGTIVGSAVFNVLFVIGMCAMFSKVLLHLTWWPLLRDSIFYIIALVVLIVSFYDRSIHWWEALIMFLIYIAYVGFMGFNARIEKSVKNYIFNRSRSSTSVTPLADKNSQVFLTLSANLAKNAFRNGALQLVIHTLDPIAEVAVERKFQRIKHHCDCVTNVQISESVTITGKNDTTKTHRIESNGNLKQKNEENTCCVNYKKDMCQKCGIYDTNKNCTDPEKEHFQLDNLKDNSQTTEDERSHMDTLKNANQILKELDAIYAETALTNRQSEPTHINKSVSIARHFHDDTCSKGSTCSLQTGVTVCKKDYQENVVDNDVSSAVSLRDSVRFSAKHITRSSSRSSCRSHRGLANVENPSSLIENIERVDNDDDEEDGPIDLSWPDTNLNRIFYVIKLPLLLLLLITLPDVRRPSLRRLFPLTFIGSILWIGGFTYLMVWWAAEIGDTAGIPIDIMGLTFLAAGTSIPDLITSVVVARQGLGDMAVSSSIGSNIFDVTVGLPIPWLIYSFADDFNPVQVTSDGLFCSTVLLFLMLLAVVITIAVSKWKLTKRLGGFMFFLYVIFITLTLLIQLNVFSCPLNN